MNTCSCSDEVIDSSCLRIMKAWRTSHQRTSTVTSAPPGSILPLRPLLTVRPISTMRTPGPQLLPAPLLPLGPSLPAPLPLRTPLQSGLPLGQPSLPLRPVSKLRPLRFLRPVGPPPPVCPVEVLPSSSEVSSALLPPPSSVPSTPGSTIINLASSTSQIYNVKHIDLEEVPSSTEITPEQFPSPHLSSYAKTSSSYSYAYKTPLKFIRPKVIRRRIFPTPKKFRNNPTYRLKENLDLHMEGFSEELRTFISVQLFHKANAHWGPKEKDLFLRFYFKSPACYSFMISIGFKLPAVCTIYRWHSEIRLPAGLSNRMKDTLTEKAKGMTAMDRKSVLLFDEMTISKELEYNIKDDLIYGLQDFGEFGRQNTVASKVMVFTLRGLNTNWRQTIAYYVGSPNGQILSQMLVSIITGVINCGLTVVATSCDQGPSNISAYLKLGSPGFMDREPYVEILQHKVFLLYDYPHLFKSVRNNLLKYWIFIGNAVVDWKILEKIYKEDKKGKNFTVLFKLRESHIKPNPFEKLSVKLATQVFSDHVYSGIMYALNTGCFKTDVERKRAKDTADFIKKMNDLFDNLNTSQQYSRNPNKEVLSDTTGTLEKLKEAIPWIQLWSSTGQKTIPPCFTGLRQTLVAIVQMWEYLKSEEQSYFLISHLNTDVAENLFSMVRCNRGSYERSPSAWRFIRNLKQIIFHHFSSAEHSGYEDSGAKPLLQTGDYEGAIEREPDEKEFEFKLPIEDNNLKKGLTLNLEKDLPENEEMELHQEENIEQLPTKPKEGFAEKLQEAAATYYAGFAAAKLKRKLTCEVCSKFLVEDDENNKDREQTLLIKLRAYATVTTDSEFGKLTVPSILFERTVRNFQTIFEADFERRQNGEKLVETWTTELMKEDIFAIPCPIKEHKETIIKFVLRGLIILTTKKGNKELKAPKRKTVI